MQGIKSKIYYKGTTLHFTGQLNASVPVPQYTLRVQQVQVYNILHLTWLVNSMGLAMSRGCKSFIVSHVVHLYI